MLGSKLLIFAEAIQVGESNGYIHLLCQSYFKWKLLCSDDWTREEISYFIFPMCYLATFCRPTSYVTIVGCMRFAACVHLLCFTDIYTPWQYEVLNFLFLLKQHVSVFVFLLFFFKVDYLKWASNGSRITSNKWKVMEEMASKAPF